MNSYTDALLQADFAVERLLQSGAKRLYEQYLKQKIKPYTTKSVSLSSMMPSEVIFNKLLSFHTFGSRLETSNMILR